MTDTADLCTVPKTNGDAPLPRKAGTRTMLPSSWISRAVKIEYVGAAGELQQTNATLLDWCRMGPVFNLGTRTVVGWDQLVLCELVED